MKGFSGANIKHLDHFITPIVIEDWPDVVIIHIGSNDIKHNTAEQTDVKDIKTVLQIPERSFMESKRQ